MTQIIELVDRYSLMKIKDIEVLGEPSIYIEDNGEHAFNFQCHLKHKNDFSAHVALLVEGQYYLITKAKKRRNEDVELSVECEHISYELLDAWDNNEVVEGDAHTIIGEYLQHTRFNLISAIPHEAFMYKPSTFEVRTRILEIADVIGGHVVFDNFNIYIRDRLGSNKGLKVELGVNLLAIEQEIDYTNSFSPASYYIDMVDLSSVLGYDDTETIEIGDTIMIVDGELGISTSEDILAIEYNPFQPQLPKISIGRYRPSFSEYIEEMEEEKEDDDANKSSLNLFKVGDIDCIPIMSDETSAVIDYLTDTSLQGIVPSADCELIENKKGVTAALKSNEGQYLTAMVTTETESGIISSFKPMPAAELANLELPKENLSVSIIMIVTEVPFADLASGLVPIVPLNEEDEPTFVEAYGVRFVINTSAGGFLNDFKVGDVDCLAEGDIDAKEQVVKFIKDQVAQPVALHSFEIVEGKLKGIYATLKDDYKKYHLTFIHSSKDADDTWTVETKKMPFTNARIFETPKHEDDSIIMVITKEPYESITSANVDSAFLYAFGVRFNLGEAPPPETDSWLSELKIGNVDCLALPGILLESPLPYLPDEITATLDYTDLNEFRGLSVALKQEYADYTIVRAEFFGNGLDDYYDMTSNPNNEDFSLCEYPYGNLKSIAFLILEAPLDEFNPDVHKSQVVGVNFVEGEPEPEPPSDGTIRYARVDTDYEYSRYSPHVRLQFINNIRDIRQAIVDSEALQFDVLSTEYYPSLISYEPQAYDIVQVVDGIITGAIRYKTSE